MTQVIRASLADQAAELLLDRIRSGEWGLGEKLPGETTLAPQLGVGRSTVREAIRQLAGRGVLATRQGAGVFVTALDAPEDWDAVLRRAGIATVIEARIAIEAEAASLAAVRRTPADLRAIRVALAHRDRQRGAEQHGPEQPSAEDGSPAQTGDGIEALVDADTAFHRAIVVAAHNPILTELFDGFTPRLRQAMIDMLRIRRGEGRRHGDDADHDAHAELTQAVADRDAEGASRRSRAHLQALRDAFA